MTAALILLTAGACLCLAVVWPMLGPDTDAVPADIVTVELPRPTPVHERLTDKVAHHGRHELNIARGTDAQRRLWEGTTEPIARPALLGQPPKVIEAEPAIPYDRYFTTRLPEVQP